MLLQFNFTNFKSFKGETTLDLTATKISEHNDRVVQIGSEKILPSAVIYGANASGKSNVLEALRFMTIYVLNSFSFGGDNRNKGRKTETPEREPFLFNYQSKESESTFEVYYITSEEEGCRTYNYGFSLDNDGVKEEWLNVKAKTSREFRRIFYRGDNELDLAGISGKSRENIQIALEKETLVVSLGSKLKIAKLKGVRDWFFNIDVKNFGDPIENALLSRMLPSEFVSRKEVQQNVIQYFSAFDPSIIGFNVRTLKSENEDTVHFEQIEIDAMHRIDGTNDTATIPLEEESAGTLKMFALYPAVQGALENGGVLCIDELNARLHPLLVRNIIISFLDPQKNTNHAQLIITSHDTWQLSTNLFRRDEIWFTEKDDAGVSTLFSLADFVDEDGGKIRKDENYERNYLLGKYGAIPQLKQFDMF